jgi:hypothetical protein
MDMEGISLQPPLVRGIAVGEPQNIEEIDSSVQFIVK